MKTLLLLLLSLLLQSCAPAQIIVNQQNETTLNQNLHSCCIIDINFSKNFAERDILSADYWNWSYALNFHDVNATGGSTCHQAMFNLRDTLVHGVGKGLNCSNCTVLDGICCMNWTKDFVNEDIQFARNNDGTFTWIDNLCTGNSAQLKYAMQRQFSVNKNAPSERIILSMEDNLNDQKVFFPNGGSDYVRKVTADADSLSRWYPSTHFTAVIDAAPTIAQNGSSSDRKWNDAIKPLVAYLISKGFKVECRLYLWDDALKIKNITSLNTAILQTIPSWIDAMKACFPNTTIAILQFGTKQSYGNYNTALGSMIIAREYQLALSNPSVTYLSYMDLKQLDNAPNTYNTLQLIGQMFTNSKSATLSGLPSQVYGFSTDIPVLKALLINENASAKTVTILGKATSLPANSVTLHQ